MTQTIGAPVASDTTDTMRAAVVTWKSARIAAAVANQAFAAIVDEKTDVTMSVYVSETSARSTR